MATKRIIFPGNILVVDYESTDETADYAARLGDVHSVGSGDDGTFNFVVGLRFSGTTLQYKYTQIAINDGVCTSVGAESAWTDVPTV